jgi:hypothetical protein
LTRKLVNVPKKELDEKRKDDSQRCPIGSGYVSLRLAKRRTTV